MKQLFFTAVLVTVLVVFATPSFATNGSQLIGVGSTQKGMAGAVTAAPEDAMTAVTNPAGMARIGSRADFNGEAFMPRRSMDFKQLPATLGGPGEETSGGTKLYGVPSLGWSAPAFNSDDIYFGGGFYAAGGLGVDYDVIDAGLAFGEADVFSLFQFAKIAPAIGWNVNEKLAVGMSLNFDYQLLEVRETFAAPAFAAIPVAILPTSADGIRLDLGRAQSVFGGGVTLGMIYDLSDTVTVGLSYISKQYFPEFKYRLGSNAIRNFPAGNFLASNTRAGTYRLDLDFPQQAAIGIALKPMEALTLELDVKWIDWDDVYDKARLAGDFDLYDTTAGLSLTQASHIDLEFGWDDQWVFALGARYALNENLALRLGYNYSESPIEEEDVFNNIAFPAIVEQHVTVGFTYNFGPHWALTGSYMHAFQEDLSGKNDVPTAYTNLGFVPSSTQTEIELVEDSIGMQVTYRF